MLIHVNRDGQDFGPYTIEELNAYLVQGSILSTDLAWYEGAAGWLPMDQVPGVILPGQDAAPIAQRVGADPLAAANPAVAAADAVAISSGTKKKKIIIISAAIAGVAALAGVLCFVWPGFLKGGDDPWVASRLHLETGGTSLNGQGDNKFSGTVEPIFKKSTCYDCHDGTGGEKVKGKFDLTKPDNVMNAIEPGKPDESEIIVRLTDKDDPMPPEGKGDMLSTSDIVKVKAWIAAGGKF